MNLTPVGFRRLRRTLTTRRRPELSLQWKLGAFVLAGLTLLFALLVGFGELLTRDSASRMAAERLSVARLTASFLDRDFERIFSQLEWEGAQINSEPNQDGESTRWAGLVRASDSRVADVYLVDASGHLVWSDPPGPSVAAEDSSDENFIREPLSTGQRFASPAFADPETGRPIVVFSVPILGSDGTPRGVLGASVDLSDSLSRTMVSAADELGPSGHAELVDQDLRLIASSERGHVLGPGEHPSFYRDLLARHESAVGLTDPIGDEDPQDRGQRHIMAFVPLKSAPWGLALGGSESAYTAMSARWLTYTLPLAFLVLVVTLLMVWHTRRRVVAPLRALIARTDAIAGGDLTTPVPTGGDGEVRVLANAFDDMRLRLLQAQVAELELSRHKDEFLAIASHELRTPVAALSALTQLQRSRLARRQPVDAHKSMTEIHEHLDRLARLITQLLDRSRIETGKLTLEPGLTDLVPLVESATQSILIADGARHQFEVQTPDTLPALVDALRFEQVLINLLDNAVKNSPVGAPVQVTLSQPCDGTARLEVRDHGPGIPAEVREHVFDRYFQKQSDGAASSAGLGLGLYVSHEIVALHQGAIAVDSPSDGGTSFVVMLPTRVA
jgi:signal transduction histidine kinase